MSKTLNTKILLRNDTYSNWQSNNPTLGKGEIGIAMKLQNGVTVKNFKIGDGTTAWNSLPWGIELYGAATSSTMGLMPAEDFVKLQGIESGAQANIITAINSTYNQSSIATAVLFTDKNNNQYDAITTLGLTAAIQQMFQDIYQKSEVYTKSEVDNKITTVFKYQGTKSSYVDLPSSNNNTGDVWHITLNGAEYVWNGSEWEELGNGTIDLSSYLQSVTIAGTTLNPSSSSITSATLKTALSLNDAASKAVADSISAANSTATTLPTVSAVYAFGTTNFTKVASSATNGHIQINGVDTTVYALPATTLDSSDILIFDCGTASTNYS